MTPTLTKTPPLTFYTANTPNGLKVSVYLHEAELEHEQVNVDLSAGEQKQPAFLERNPNGKIPVIVDHERDVTVFESGAILTYLASQTGVLQPMSQTKAVAVNQWLHFQIGGIGPMLGQLWWFLHGSKTGNAEAIARYRKESLRLIDVVDTRLARSPYLATDDYSIADIAAFSWLRTHDELGLDLTPFPHVRRWLAQVEARPAVQAAMVANRGEARSKEV
ncbi:glutathione S-transferase [Pandoraea captiosa]|uniref:Glutathione S-transferase n=1 Tax=Pandoraea captiosa TaxID=2508302 RepID=A0A5E5A0Y9_9BURK|nr:glutathione S-transferase family protein [Pandoraea captiosa]VVE66946.1 glutathione S-transferase [Pandoraea captiosa]